MVNEISYVNIREGLSRTLRHPLLQDVNLEAAIQYTLDFIGLFNIPKFYESKETEIHIECFQGDLPCDLIRIDQVMDLRTHICLRSMTSSFFPKRDPDDEWAREPQFRTEGRTIHTSFEHGDILVAYKAIKVDEEGLPLLIDNSKFLKALDLYIKCQVFSDLFEQSKIKSDVLSHAEQQYAFAAGQLSMEFAIPSVSEAESLSNSINQIVTRNNEFVRGFERLGNREFTKIQS